MARYKETLLPLSLMVLGVLLMVLGSCRGELKVLFAKAVNICLECIGIG